MNYRRLTSLSIICLLFVGLVFGAIAMPAVAVDDVDEDPDDDDPDDVVWGSPDIRVLVPDNVFDPGETATVEFELNNVGEILIGGGQANENTVRIARATEMEVSSGDAPVTIRTGRTAIGTVSEGQSFAPGVRMSVDEDAEPGVYDLEVEFEYTYVYRIDESETPAEQNETRTTVTRNASIVIDEAADFRIERVEGNPQVGDTGAMTMTIRNVGNAPARDATITVGSADGEFVVGESGAAGGIDPAALGDAGALADALGADLATGAGPTNTFAGEWDVDETRTIDFPVGTVAGTEPRDYTLTATVDYRDRFADDRQSRQLRTSIRPAREQDVRLPFVKSDLEVGEDGYVEGTIWNRGPATIDDVIVRINPENPNVVPRDPEASLGDLEELDSERFRFRIGIRADADPGNRSLPLIVEYRNQDGERRIEDRLSARVDVAEETDPFEVEVINGTIAAGDSTVLALRVTNTGTQRLTDIEGKVFTSSPLDSDRDEAFIPALGPGQSETILVDMSVDADALPNTYAAAIDFRYEDRFGDSRLSERNRLPIQVLEPEDDDGIGGLLLVLGVLAVIVAVAAAVLYRRGIRSTDDLRNSVEELRTDGGTVRAERVDGPSLDPDDRDPFVYLDDRESDRRGGSDGE